MLRVLTESEIAEMNAIRWWHRIPVGLDAEGNTIYTPGEVMHGADGDPAWVTDRFGLPADLTGKNVLDIGGWDGFFSFEAEKRGAAQVINKDVPQESGGNWGGTTGFEFARRVTGSAVHSSEMNIELPLRINTVTGTPIESYYDLADVVLCYGVLYHLKHFFAAIENLFTLTKRGGLCLIETARDPDNTLHPYAAWCFIPGKGGDATNYWYPSEGGLRRVLEYVGFVDIAVIYDGGERMTIKATKPAGEAAQETPIEAESPTETETPIENTPTEVVPDTAPAEVAPETAIEPTPEPPTEAGPPAEPVAESPAENPAEPAPEETPAIAGEAAHTE